MKIRYNLRQGKQKTRLRPDPPGVTDRIVVVQIVFSRWDKNSRGGQGAVLRNQIPEAVELLLPSAPISEPSFVVHTSHYLVDSVPVGSCLPTKALQVLPMTEPFTNGSISVHLAEEQVHVDYNWSRSGGMPERYSCQDVLVLEKGEWGRVRFNERHSFRGFDLSAWWYEKWVFNIGFFDTLDSRLFLETKPAHIYSHMRLLW